MSVGLSRAIGWKPAELVTVAHWLETTSTELDTSAGVVRDQVERGTERQSGDFIDRVRRDGAAARMRILGASERFLTAAAVLRRAEADLTPPVTVLCRVLDDARDLGFNVGENGGVTDRQTTAGREDHDAQDRASRRHELQNDAVGALRTLNEVDERVNRELHDIVHRPVRDRTDKGNWDPTSTYGAGAVSSVTGLFGHSIEYMVENGDMPQSPRWWNQARNFGVLGNALGFIGGVASAPDDEPLVETLTAEGVGSLAGMAGSMLGGPLLSRIPKVGPALGPVGEVGGGIIGGLVTSATIRRWYDNAN